MQTALAVCISVAAVSAVACITKDVALVTTVGGVATAGLSILTHRHNAADLYYSARAQKTKKRRTPGVEETITTVEGAPP